jgi:hypothetical protein
MYHSTATFIRLNGEEEGVVWTCGGNGSSKVAALKFFPASLLVLFCTDSEASGKRVNFIESISGIY